MKLETERILLRPIEIRDLESIHRLHSFPESARYNTLPIPRNIDQTRKTIEPWLAENRMSDAKSYTFALHLKRETTFIGLCGIKLSRDKYKRAEIWYIVDPEYWNRGYATETVQAIIRFLFEKFDIHRIEAGCAVENSASIRVLEKAGMTKEGIRRKILPLQSGWADNYLFAILETDDW